MSTLIAFDGNPMPEPSIDGFMTTPDGFDLRYAVFRSSVSPIKGSVVLLQGRNECIEKYGETIGDLGARGFDVCTFDWRGQGRSTRFFSDAKRGYVDDFEQYVSDLDHAFSAAFLPEARPPFFILAHSMGGLIALLAAPLMNNRIRRMVISAPFLGLSREGPPHGMIEVTARAMSFLGMGKSYMGAGAKGAAALELETNKLTSDPRRFARNKAILDPRNGLGLGGATAGWLRAAITALRRVHEPEHMARIHIPTLMVTTSADRVVDSTAADDFVRRIRSGSLLAMAGARHELMQERDHFREQFFAAFDAFVPGSERPDVST